MKHQDHVYLTAARICYIPDFRFFDVNDNEIQWAESKGFETSDWKIKKRLWAYYGPGKLHIYKGTAKRINLVETVNGQTEEHR